MEPDDDFYPLGEYPPLECFADMIAGWVCQSLLKVLDAVLFCGEVEE